MFIFVVYSLGFWYGGGLIVKKEMKPGDVLTVFFAIMMGKIFSKNNYFFFSFLRFHFLIFLGAMSIGQVANLLPDIAKATAAAGSLFWVIDRVPEITV